MPSSSQYAELPAGFEAKRDLRSGRVYFVDHNKKTTQWLSIIIFFKIFRLS